LQRKRGFVTRVDKNGFQGTVFCIETGDTLVVDAARVEKVAPNKKDRVCFIGDDENRGISGVLVGLDGSDAIVKLDAGGEFKYSSSEVVCKMRDKA
jgi:hypothetical protein